MMTPFAKFIFAVVLALTVVAGVFVAIASDTRNAEAQSRYLAPAFDTTLIKHKDVDANPRMDFIWGSDDAAYRSTHSAVQTRSFLHTLGTLVTLFLPNTAAPHGAVTCTLPDGHGGTFTVSRDSCASL